MRPHLCLGIGIFGYNMVHKETRCTFVPTYIMSSHSSNPHPLPQSCSEFSCLPKDPFDVVVIGGGPGGYVAAIRAAQLGLKTALIEGKHLGGVCLNWGCIPTKALLKSASMLSALSDLESFGFSLPPGDVRINIKTIVQRSRQLASQLQSGIKGLLAKNGVSVFSAWATFESITAHPHRLYTPTAPSHPNPSAPGMQLDLKTESLTAHGLLHTLRLTDAQQQVSHVSGKNIVIATGARARTLFPEDLGIWSAQEAMTPDTLPQSMLIIGAGAIGVEFASFYQTLGTQVTLVEQSETILPVEDEEIVAIASRSFIQDGMIIETQSTVSHVMKTPDGWYKATIKHLHTGVEQSWTGERILVAIGVMGNTEHLGLENTAVRVEKGHIVTHAHHTTDELGVYAIGDVAGAPWLAHKASHEGVVCIEYIANLKTTLRIAP